jgi:transposase
VGIKSVVIRPQKLDELGKGVKNDKLDAQMLAQRLDRYVNGNKKALRVVRIPSEKEEQERSEIRQCEQLKRHRKRVILQGNGILMYNGYTENKMWWGRRKWEKVCEHMPNHIKERLKPLKAIIGNIAEQEDALITAIESKAPKDLPFGLGLYTFEYVRREVSDWNRFTNRRQVGSYMGLCPRERSSGGTRRLGSISKHGNPNLRTVLIQLSWRLVRGQPNYRGTQKYLKRCSDPNTNSGRRKKAIVAVARELAIDLWRIFTKRVTPQELGLIMKEHI